MRKAIFLAAALAALLLIPACMPSDAYCQCVGPDCPVPVKVTPVVAPAVAAAVTTDCDNCPNKDDCQPAVAKTTTVVTTKTWYTKSGRRGPRRFIQRIRSWRPGILFNRWRTSRCGR